MKILMNFIVILFAVLCTVQCASLPHEAAKAKRCKWNCKHATSYEGGYHPLYDSKTGVCTCQHESGDIIFSRRFKDDKDVMKIGEIFPDDLPMDHRIDATYSWLERTWADVRARMSEGMSFIRNR